MWDAVDPGGVAYTKGAALYSKDRQALNAMFSVVPNDVMRHLSEKMVAAETWVIIRVLHQGSSRVKEANLQTLMKNYEDLKMSMSESVDGFSTMPVELSGAIKDLGENLVDLSIVCSFLRAAAPRHI